MSEPTVTLHVTRYHPEHDSAPRQSYSVPYEDWVVLDALNYIKDQIDGALTFRWSCRMGVCGSCGMMVNGVPRLTCAAFLRGITRMRSASNPEQLPDHPRFGHRHE